MVCSMSDPASASASSPVGMAGSDAIPPVPFEVEEAGRIEGSRAGLALPVTAIVIILQKWVPDGVSCEISTGF
jgi:hypothetical protein